MLGADPPNILVSTVELELEHRAMAESARMGNAFASEAVQAVDGWGILRLPRWLGDQIAAGDQVDARPDVAPSPTLERREQSHVASPEQVSAPRAAALALRQTLDAWRAAERDLATLVIDSPDRPRVLAEAAYLRAAHHRLFDEISRPASEGAAVGAYRR